MNLTRPLRVLPNPYLGWGRTGEPSSAIPYEPDLVNGDTHVRYVGATPQWTEIRKAVPRSRIEADHHMRFDYQVDAPTVVDNTDYYRRFIRSGELVAADLETWKLAGGDPKDFTEPKAYLAAAKAACAALYRAHYGDSCKAIDDHLAKFHAQPAPAPAAPPAADAAPQAKGSK